MDIDGERIYVGRAFHEGDWLPAKVIPGKNAAYISYNGEEVFVDRFEVSIGAAMSHKKIHYYSTCLKIFKITLGW